MAGNRNGAVTLWFDGSGNTSTIKVGGSSEDKDENSGKDEDDSEELDDKGLRGRHCAFYPHSDEV